MVPFNKKLMFSSTLSRLVFFGGHYLSIVFLSRELGQAAKGFLLAIAVAEFFRILFDYGLENTLLSRVHQQGSESDKFNRGKLLVRSVATVLGQFITTTCVVLLCWRNNTPVLLPLIASLQFSALMTFGYLQAHLQTDGKDGMKRLFIPLVGVTLIQSLILLLNGWQVLPTWMPVISFQLLAVGACLITVRIGGEMSRKSTIAVFDDTYTGASRLLARHVLKRCAPLGNVAVVGLAYARIDSFIVSLVSAGPLLTQYLLFQRLASAPLMFFSTVASVQISALSSQNSSGPLHVSRIKKYRGFAYLTGLLAGVVIALLSPFVAQFFSLDSVALPLLILQCIILALQISNGFHAAMFIGLGMSSRLWIIAKNNATLAIIILPLAAWQFGAIGVASALCGTELFCAIQYCLMAKSSALVTEAAYAD